MSDGISIAPLLPAYNLLPNEVDQIINKLPKGYTVPTVIYNDDNVSLQTHLEYLEKNGRIQAVYIPFQVGKAEAMRCGYRKLFDFSMADIIVQIDGRSKQPAEEVEKLVHKLIETNSHMIVGNRYGLQNIEGQVHRLAISTLFSAIIESLTGYQLQDTVCGARAICT